MRPKKGKAYGNWMNAGVLRLFFAGMALFLILIVEMGFGSTYGIQLIAGTEISGLGVVETDWVIHIQSAVFIGLMMLFLTQTLLVAKGQTARHMAFGKLLGISLAAGVLIAGTLIVYDEIQAFILKGIYSTEEWVNILLIIMQSWMGLLLFAGLIFMGCMYRKKPEMFKRYMILKLSCSFLPRQVA